MAVRSILCDESIFDQLALGDTNPYRLLMVEHFHRGATLYILSETIVEIYLQKALKLPTNVFEPFRTLAPAPAVIRSSALWATTGKITFQRALIINCANHYHLSVGLTDYKPYANTGLHRRFFVRSGTIAQHGPLRTHSHSISSRQTSA